MVARNNPKGPLAGNLFPVAGEGSPVQRLGRSSPSLFVQTFDLSAARDTQKFEASGNFIWAIDSNDIDDQLTITFNSQRGQGLPIKVGAAFAGVLFDRWYLTNAAIVSGSITIVYGLVDPVALQILNSGAAASAVFLAVASINLLTKPTGFVSLPDDSVAAVATELVMAANAARREAFIHNLAGNTSLFRIGDAGAGAAEGVELAVGQTLILSHAAAIYAYNSDVGAQSLSLAYTED